MSAELDAAPSTAFTQLAQTVTILVKHDNHGLGGVWRAQTYPEWPVRIIVGFAPVASINCIPLVLYVHPSFQAKTVPELITYAKATQGKLSIATPPEGTPAPPWRLSCSK